MRYSQGLGAWRAGVVWCGGGITEKRNTKEHEWAITSCFCFPALPVFNEV